MFLFQKQKPSTKPSHQDNIVQSLSEHIASIEFDTSGNVISANPLFLNAVGYRLEELTGKHHRIFALPQSVNHNNISSFGPLLLKVSRILILLCATKKMVHF